MCEGFVVCAKKRRRERRRCLWSVRHAVWQNRMWLDRNVSVCAIHIHQDGLAMILPSDACGIHVERETSEGGTMATRLLAVCGLVSLVAFPLLACDHDTPARASGSSTVNPTTPTENAVVSVGVGTADSLSATLAPGDVGQLFALAKYTNDTTSYVTNRVAWQLANPV